MNKSGRISLAVVAAVTLLPAMGALGASSQREVFVIEIDVFSGRPNPRLTLDDPTEIQGFTAKLKESCDRASPVSADRAPEYPGILGYRGMSVLRAIDGAASSRSLTIARRTVHMAKQNAPLACKAKAETAPADRAGDVHLVGAGNALEAYVAALALRKGVIAQPVYDAILKELAAR